MHLGLFCLRYTSQILLPEAVTFPVFALRLVRGQGHPYGIVLLTVYKPIPTSRRCNIFGICVIIGQAIGKFIWDCFANGK